MKKIILVLLLINTSMGLTSTLPENMPQAIYDDIVQQVITDKGYFDNVAVEQGITQWLLMQPLPNTNGDLLTSGSCNTCEADNQGTDTQFKHPRNVRVKAKKRSNGKYPTVLKIKWKKPKKLPVSIRNDYELSNYKVYISKNGSSYEVFQVDPKYKRNGKLKRKQNIKFKDRNTGSYQVQVQAIYVPTTTAKSAQTKGAITTKGSPYTGALSFNTDKKATTVGQLTGAAHSCLLNNGFVDATLLLDIITPIDCSNQNLINSDIKALAKLSNVRSLDLSTNPLVTSISALSNLVYLEYLDLSNNPGLTLPDFSTFEGLKTLYLNDMGLTTVPDLSLNDNLETLSLKDNSIVSGLDLLPSSLIIIEVSGRESSFCADIIASGNNTAINTISQEASNMNLSDCAGVLGLNYIIINGGNFPNSSQNLSNFTGDNSLCGLSVKSTNLKILDGTVPMEAIFYLNTNTELKYVEPLINQSGNVDFIANQTVISDDNENLLCSNRFKLAEASTASLLKSVQQKNIPVQDCGPQLAVLSQFKVPNTCSPDPVPTFEIYTDNNNSKRFLAWTAHPDASIWGVTYYKIQSKLAGVPVSFHTVNANEPSYYQLNSTTPDSYEIIACTDTKCGYSKTVSSASFKTGITSVSNALAIYSTNPSDQFTIQFSYKNSPLYDANSLPTRFEISSDMDPNFGIIINCSNCSNQNSNLNNYSSSAIAYTSNLGSQLNIKACNDTIGCGAQVSVNITPTITSADIPKPIWVVDKINPHSPPNQDGTYNYIVNTAEGMDIGNYSASMSTNLTWTFESNADMNKVDYIKVHEIKPVANVNMDLPTQNLPNTKSAHTYFYIENDKSKPSNSIKKAAINRIVRGGYFYKIQACKRVRETKDVCSIGEVRINTENFYDFYVKHLFGNSGNEPSLITNLNWYSYLINGETKYAIKWQVSESKKTDYFYVTQQSSNSTNACLFGVSPQNNPPNPTSAKIRINFSDTINPQQNNINRIWTSETHCENMGANTIWKIRACTNGHGCNEGQTIDMNATTPSGSSSLINTTTAASGAPVSGGPGDFLPGMWWNPDLAGTGWHFYWASELRFPSTYENTAAHEKYGNTYDLIGYWFAFKQDIGRGVWTPTWFETRLKQISINTNSEFSGCFEGDILSRKKVGNETNPTNVGNLQVCFHTGDNRNATLIFDIGENNGILAQVSEANNLGPYESLDDGRLKLEVNDFSQIIGTNNGTINTPNDDDHYSGLWQHKVQPTAPDTFEPYADVSMLTWIEQGLEVSTLALYDDIGDPIWFQSVYICDTANCSQSGEGYFDAYDSSGSLNLVALETGFNPLGAPPVTYSYNGVLDPVNVSYYGNMGRCLNPDSQSPSTADNLRFRKANMWYNITTQVPGRTVTANTSGINCTTSGIELTKTASLHDIRYFINDKDEKVTICDPNTNESGECIISFAWFTDDDFPAIKPYYTTDPTNSQNSYNKLSDICPLVPVGNSFAPKYVVPKYKCNFTSMPGHYQFQLRKDKYTGTGTEIIAESKTMEILPCDGDCTRDIGEVANTLIEALQAFIPNNQPGAGPIPGSGGVSGGSATYNLPLVVPPGRNGMTPSISVNYSSKGGNGILGVGWSLSVGSSIYRCPQTLAQDGKSIPVTLDNTDRLCLDGQRLMLNTATLPSDADYWVGAQGYRTEQDSFVKVTKTASGYQVQTKSGRTNTYIDQGDNPITVTWSLKFEQDTFGNIITYNYNENIALRGVNEVLLTSIIYSSAPTANDNREIRLSYSTRTDSNISYLAGQRTDSTKKLDRVETWYPKQSSSGFTQTLARTYAFDYSYSIATQRLILNTVSETPKNSITRIVLENDWSQDQTNSGWSINNIGSPKYRLHKAYEPIDSDIPIITDTEVVNLLTRSTSPSTELYNVTGGDEMPIMANRVLSDFDGDGIKEVFVTYTKLNATTGLQEKVDELRSYNLVYENGIKKPLLKARVNIPLVQDIDLGTIFKYALSPTADFNNDGRTDILYKQNGEYHIGVWNNSVSEFSNDINNPSDFNDYFADINTGIPVGDFSTVQVADVNNDDLKDIVLLHHNAGNYSIQFWLASQSASGTSSAPGYTPTFTQGTPINLSSGGDKFTLGDFNGDGIIDIQVNYFEVKQSTIGEANFQFKFYFGTIANGITSYVSKEPVEIGIDNDLTKASVFKLFNDINGDGLSDFIYTKDIPNSGVSWFVQINKGGSINDEIYSPAQDTGTNFGYYSGDCKPTNCSPRYSAGLKQVDIDNDGITEILLPNPNKVLVNHCTFFFDQVTDPSEPYDFVSCSDPVAMNSSYDNSHTIGQIGIISYYNQTYPRAAWDGGIYAYSALKFQLNSDGTVSSNVNVDTNYISGLSKSKFHSNGDYLGDGLLDASETIGCYSISGTATGFGCLDQKYFYIAGNQIIDDFITEEYPGGTPELKKQAYFEDGNDGLPVIAINQSAMPDMLIKVNKPTNSISTSWSYYPLSTVLSGRASDFQLYSIPDSDRYVNEDGIKGDHFYFNSSMYVVSEIRQTNNYGNDAVTEYAYEEAVYNNKGRGFQGFRTIKVRSRPDESIEGLNYETTSVSTFHQVFPLAGKLEEINVFSGSGTLLSKETYCYDGQTYDTISHSCDNSTTNYSNDGSIVYHPLQNKYAVNNELNGVLTSTSETNINYDLTYGNILNQTNILISELEQDYQRTETTTTTNTYNNADTTNWWIDKLLTTKVTKTATDTRDQTGINTPVNTGSQTTHSSFVWKNIPTGPQRQLECQYTSLTALPINFDCSNTSISNNDISRNSFFYDTNGNITNVITTATDYANTATDRSVNTSYTSDGYFPASINKSGLITTFTYDNATGQVLTITTPDGNSVTSSYDAYGFKTQDRSTFGVNVNNIGNLQSIPISYSAIRNCNGDCNTQQNMVNASINTSVQNTYGMITGHPQLKYYTEQRQNGQPQVITWYDSANNPVITKTYHSDNVSISNPTKFNYVVNIKSPLGTNAVSTQPFVSTPLYKTISAADVKGRIVEKVSTIENLNQTGGSCTVNTMYDHNGTKTTILAGNLDSTCTFAGNSNLQMSRTYDVTGKLLSTTDALANTVKYWYDASGNPLILQDANGNQIQTTFDSLGRKQTVIDPNMGGKTFNYNGFGEVIQQTASGDTYSTFYQYDALGRITHQYSNVGSDKAPLDPESNIRSYHDSYSYDSVGRLQEAIRESNLENNECLPGINYCFQAHYQKTITYDNQSRVSIETTTLNNALTNPPPQAPDGNGYDNVTFNTKYYYDGNYNRLKQVVYDDRYSVHNLYTKYGALQTQIDPVTQQELLHISAWNEKGQELRREFNGQPSIYSETDYYPSTGQVKQITNTSTGDSEILTYDYDGWGNIQSQVLTRGTTTATENFVYDRLHRLTSTNGISSKVYSYNNIGNIMSKNDFANSYDYDTLPTSCNLSSAINGPNAVKSAALINTTQNIDYYYDNKGNRVADCLYSTGGASAFQAATATYQYDYNNLLVESVSSISGTQQQLQFNYGPDNQRYRKFDQTNNEITLYANKDYERIYKNGFLREQKYYITSYLTLTKVNQTGELKKNFMQKDRLGSTTQILDENGLVLHTKSYDAFGKPRNGDWSDMGGLFDAKLDFADIDASGNLIGTIDISKRGFTDHEHLDEMQLIHMNGRMYDYNNGRFLSVDPFISNPTSTQALNPYTYILNNPLAGTDPTGYNPIWAAYRVFRIVRTAGKFLGRTAARIAENSRKSKLAKQNARTKQKAQKIQRAQREKATKQREAKKAEIQKSNNKAETKNGNTNKDTTSKPKSENNPSNIGSKKGERAGQNNVEGPVNQKIGKTKDGKPRIKEEFPDGSSKDITPDRVKEKVPEPRAKSGTKNVKFNKSERTESHNNVDTKRAPTAEELKKLDEVKPK